MPTPTAAQHAAAERIAAELAHTAFALPGSLAHRYTRCGKPNCRCKADPPHLHGPYPTWTRKAKGKTITRRLTEEQYTAYRPWIEAARRKRTLLAELEALSLEIIQAEPHPKTAHTKPQVARPRKTPAS
jgi:hypothetical protein